MTLMTLLTLMSLLQLRGADMPNVLVIGPPDATEAAVERITTELGGVIETRQFPGPLALGARIPTALILREVGALNRSQQIDLLNWLDSSPRIPIVSLHSTPLFDLVRSGAFSDQLYYRLNTILVS
jgi:hypothetical protein